MPRPPQLQIVAAAFPRPETGFVFSSDDLKLGCSSSGKPGWQSNGGPHRGHPARALPFSMEVKIDPDYGHLVRLHILGILAMYSGKDEEAAGTLGASIQVSNSREALFRQDLLNGRHYRDARDLTPLSEINGDGTTVETVGYCNVQDTPARVDLLSIDIPPGGVAELVRFKDLASAASFVVFDIFFEYAVIKGCPFQAESGGVALGEIGSSIRIGDRLKFTRARDQMLSSLAEAEDLDEARGEALTFLAVVIAATIELGGSREMHRELLTCSRELEGVSTLEGITEVAKARADSISATIFKDLQSPSSHLVTMALAMVERSFARNLTDSGVAAQLGLSTSHFRFLFREATGQPFHKFLVSKRLEKARQMLTELDMPISDIAMAVGFAGLTHFSRAFTQRFHVSPTSVRRVTQ